MKTIESNKQVALNWIDAFNEHDLEKLLNLYADDAVHFSPKLKVKEPDSQGWLKGKENLRGWWAAAFDKLPGLQYHLKNLIVNRDQLLMEYLRQVPGEPDMMVAEILEIENAIIVRSRVYHGG